uniref:Enoyl-CoA hydratase n=1 Tax=Candidatus Kentrum sp. TC TaxID=2126339 RepID=A0A451AAQ5_9GAMM|nr:MAG: enoyl-CoA hydratase [Candidatus Kentron sp. TC]VFK50029.1 MAG: enoyl-CoA hydratase [Candidatus Kentron sp. TC]VFK63121.1 MAG: enoyl-CoA hydratase [Candidatus Kentron sp. TC]
MSYENILFEKPEEGIYLITINRPKVLNALNAKTLTELTSAIQSVGADKDARVLLITGAGEKSFVAGGDIAEMQNLSAMQAKAFGEQGLGVMRSLEQLPVPVIAVINGFCLGGGNELAMACDWMLASDKALFGQPEVNLGVTPGFGGTQRLSRRVGTAMALEMITTGRNVKADEAKEIGLVNHVYPAGELMEQAMKMAKSIAGKGPVSIKLAKEAIQRGQHMDLDSAGLFESEIFGLCFATEDQKEGMTAFVEKRKAEFKNK